MDDRRLREYAFKIFNGDKDYSLNKAFRLFPKYFPKIAFYYTELVSQKQEELTRRTLQQLGYIKAVELRNTAASAHKEMKKYRNQILQELKDTDIYKQSFEKEYQIDEYVAALSIRQVQIYKNIKEIAIVNREALRAVEKTAQKYRYNDIFTEAATYEIKNEEILWQVIDALKEAEERTDRFYYYET